MTAYYAHCMAIYNTPQEARDIETLERLGLTVVNPNKPWHDCMVKALKAREDGTSVPYMAYFGELVRNCDVFAFRALPGGAMPGGIAKELDYARKYEKPIIELPTFALRSTLTIDQSREYLKEVGQR